MGQLGLFEGFEGFEGFGDELVVEETKPKKSEKKKKEDKSSNSKSKASKVKAEEKVTLPVDISGNSIIARYATSDLGKEEVTATELLKKLTDVYPFANVCELKKASDSKLLLCVKSDLKAAAADTEVRFDGLLPVTVAFGPLSSQYYAEDFEAKDTITVSDVIKKFSVSCDGVFENASVYWDEKKMLAVPFFGPNAFAGLDQEVKLPVKVGLGEETEYTKEEFEGADSISLKRLTAEVRADSTDGTEICYVYGNGRVIPVLCSKSSTSAKVEYVDLPCKMAFTFKPERVDLTPEMFNGKTTIKIQDVQTLVSEHYKIFTKENTELYYVKEDNIVVVNRKSSTKGACVGRTVVPSLMAAREAVKKAVFPICYIDMGNCLFRYEKAGIGEIIVPVRNDFTVITSGNMQVALSIPKIPKDFLEETVRMFRTAPEKEMAVQIWYNGNRFKLVVPEVVNADKTSITTSYDGSLFKEGFYVVCDIHSHNTMPAFFSSIDNEDEIGTQLYGVIGNIDHNSVSMKFRVGCEGCYKELTIDEIFA